MKIINLIQKNKFESIRFKSFKSKGKHFHAGRSFTVKGPEYIEIGKNFSFGDHLKLETWELYNGIKTGYIPSLIIGDDVSFMNYCQISCLKSVVIGNGCLFGDNVLITDNFHGGKTVEELIVPPQKRNLYSKGEVIIGDNVWLGRNVCIMPAVKIGSGAIIGANSVVTHDIPCNTIAVGAPARVIDKITSESSHSI